MTHLKNPILLLLFGITIMAMLKGCTHMPPPTLGLTGLTSRFETGTIVDTASGRTVTFDQMIADMAKTRVVFVGERHTDPEHHRIQLEVIQALKKHWSDMQVGMEMFDHTYQSKLDRWTKGEFDYETLLKETHWYANWRFNDTLYKPILDYVKESQMPLTGLNVPFHLPKKISVGGLESLSEAERRLLPEHIDTTRAEHRAYLKEIFEMHGSKGRKDFENFYAAQCTWEDGMASAIAKRLSKGPMVVVVGNGHIQYKYGVPQRMHDRTQAPFKTLYLTYPQKKAESRDLADYIWVTPRPKMGHPHRRG